MQAVRMAVDVLTRRNMQLHCRFIITKKHTLNVFHFVPIRAAVMEGNGNMIPTHANRRYDAQRDAGFVMRDVECATVILNEQRVFRQIA